MGHLYDRTMNWQLRSAGADDVQAVLALWRESGAEPTSTDNPDDLRLLLGHDMGALIVADSPDGIIGTLIAAFDGWRASMYRLVVHPSARRKGLARALVDEAERRLAGRGAKRCNALVVLDHPHAVGFWAEAGYERDARMGRFVRNLPG